MEMYGSPRKKHFLLEESFIFLMDHPQKFKTFVKMDFERFSFSQIFFLRISRNIWKYSSSSVFRTTCRRHGQDRLSNHFRRSRRIGRCSHSRTSFYRNTSQKLKEKGIQMERVTLHVGPGTFYQSKPNMPKIIKCMQNMQKYLQKRRKALNEAKREGKRIIAVGSTSLRTLESATDEEGILSAFSGSTQLFLFPPADFRFVDGFLQTFTFQKAHYSCSFLPFYPWKDGRKRENAQHLSRSNPKELPIFSYGDAMLLCNVSTFGYLQWCRREESNLHERTLTCA